MREGRTQYTQATGLRRRCASASAAGTRSASASTSRRGASSSPRARRRRCSSPAWRWSSAGDEVLMPDPSYPCNRHFVAAADGHAGAAAHAAPKRFQLSAATVAGRIGAAARAACCWPRRPTRPAPRSTRTRCAASSSVVRARGGFTLRRRDLPRPELRRRLRPHRAGAWRRPGHQHQQLLEVLQHDRLAPGLAGRARRAGAGGRAAGAEPLHLPSTVAQHAALACFEPESIAEYERRRAEFRARRDFLVPALERSACRCRWCPTARSTPGPTARRRAKARHPAAGTSASS